MNRKLSACMLSLILGAIVTANANAYTAGFIPKPYDAIAAGVCSLIPDGGPASGLLLKLAKDFCL
ncbi:hypothetical protein [Xenorhabdus doucetiae]|uniref:Uncharacterized protein n=1 Tax=Xenorhabdus doucetiae TaxID=351671 RepID=A0A068QSC8_9GAMM|nr:hypothetical protein [Xenorhabdus doucetiae]TYP11620.1 hypothetical protein LY16_00977 [Xenorhabdus doucetiae]CDG17689.1 exported protein of unknown function [Xenorhabdus doucetiae]